MASVGHFSYIVERNDGHWTVRLAGGHSAGRFHSRRQALRSALEDADRVRKLGNEVHVLACRANGSLKRIPDHIRT